MTIPNGLCQCGCGGKTTIAVKNSFKENRFKDKPMKFILGHHVRIKFGSDANNWKDGRKKHNQGYIVVLKTDHPRESSGYVLEHILIAEKVLGKPLPVGAEIHHINGNGKENQNTNLIICENHAYHHLLHVRQRALEACGHADWKKCWICKQWDNPNNLYGTDKDIHPQCWHKYTKQLRLNHKKN